MSSFIASSFFVRDFLSRVQRGVLNTLCFLSCAGILLLGLSGESQAADELLEDHSARGQEDYRFQRSYSSDMRGTDQYDMGRLVEKTVVVKAYIFPEKGVAQIVYSLPESPELTYLADTQLVSVLSTRGIHKNLLQPGDTVKFVGWSKSLKNHSGSNFLVRDIVFLNKRQQARFHGADTGLHNR